MTPSKYRPPEDIPLIDGLPEAGQRQLQVFLRRQFLRLAEDLATATRNDAPTVVFTDTRLDVPAGAKRRLTPPKAGMTVVLEAPSQFNAGEEVVLFVEAPRGSLAVISAPGVDDGGKVFLPLVNGARQATYTAAGVITLRSNGSTAWSSTSEIPSESPASFQALIASTPGTPGAVGAKGATGAAGAPAPPTLFEDDGILLGMPAPPGKDGRDGAAGSAAPQLALDEDGPWLTMPAPPGINGTNGVDGVPGVNAAPYAQFPVDDGEALLCMPLPGPQGIQGIQGIQGPSGSGAAADNPGIMMPVEDDELQMGMFAFPFKFPLVSTDFTFGLVPLTGLATQATDTFLANIAGITTTPIAVNLAILAGAGLVFGTHTLDVTAGAGASLVVSANDIQRGALTGAITAAQDSNATAFGVLAAKSVLANATNASAVPAALAGTAAFQHLRVNSANNALEWSVLTTGDFPAASVPLTALATLPTWAQVLAAGNTSGAGAVNSPTINAALGSGLIFGADPGGNDQIRSTGQISIAAGSQLVLVSQVVGMQLTNTTAARNFSFTNGGLDVGPSAAAVPVGPTANNRGVIWNKTQGTGGTTRLVYTAKDNATNFDYGLDCTGVTPQLTAPSVAALTTVLDTTGRFTIRANTAVAGNRWKCYFSVIFVRGATPSALNLNCFFGIGVPSISLALTAPTAAGTYFLRCEATFTVFTIGAGGTCGAEMFAWCTNVSGGTGAGLMAGNANMALALATTTDLILVGQCQMNAVVAATSIQASGGNIERVC